MIERIASQFAQAAFHKYPVLTVTGPRQSGKTTLARTLFPDRSYYNLEELLTRQFATEDPVGFIAQMKNGGIIDEIQRVPKLLSQIQFMVDEHRSNGVFVLTGSSQLSLHEGISQTLAGRTTFLRLLPFSMAEIQSIGGDCAIDSLIFNGGYPRIYDQKLDATLTYGDYIETYIERDLRQIANIRNLSAFRRFLQLCAGRIGQLLNCSSLANDVGVSKTTIENWLSILQSSYLIFLLPPFHANIRKRLVKSPKLYFYDTGVAAYLMGINNPSQLPVHPLRGSLFENLVITELVKDQFNRGKRVNLHFYRDSDGNEVDILFPNGSAVIPIEIKSGQTITSDYFKGFKPLQKVLGDQMQQPIVIYGGNQEQQRSDAVITTVHQMNTALPK